MHTRPVTDERAVSPVVAAALLIGITVLLAFAIGTVVTDQDLGTAEEPSVTLSFEVSGDDVTMFHEGGDPLDADTIVVVDQDGQTLAGLDSDLTAGESDIIVEDIDGNGVEVVKVIWQDPDGDTTSILATFKI